MSNNLCWNCQNATGGCNWSRNLTPVEGWTATPIKIKRTVQDIRGSISGYQIHSCPEYVPEIVKAEPEVKRYVPTEDEKAQVRALRRQGWSIQRIMNATGLTQHYVEKYTKGITDKRKKIPKHIREEVRTMIKSGLSKREVARRTGISNNTVIKISREA